MGELINKIGEFGDDTRFSTLSESNDGRTNTKARDANPIIVSVLSASRTMGERMD